MQTLHTPFARLAAVVGAATVLVLTPLALSQQTTRISITTGGTGGVYYPMGGGMANVTVLDTLSRRVMVGDGITV